MSIVILYTPEFKRDYKKLSGMLQDLLKKKGQLFEQEPFHPLLNNHALGGDRLGQWSINVTGDWRAIYEFQDAETVVFVEIDTHSNLYK